MGAMEPHATRPHMPGYGVLSANQGTGLLPWSEAQRRLAASHDYWLATTWPTGRPHVMPVWGLWDDDAVWISTGGRSRKLANLRRDPRCVITSSDARNPVIVDGEAKIVTEIAGISRFLRLLNEKYGTSYAIGFLDPAVNATIRIVPVTAFALLQADFTGSPTRWRFATQR